MSETMNRVLTEDYCHPYVIYCQYREDIPKIQREVDKLFSDYAFYPEIDWGQYGYRPPEKYNVLGAWRHPETKVFIFLLDNPFMMSMEPNTQLVLYIVGEFEEIQLIKNKLNKMKSKFAIEERKGENITNIEDRMEKIHKSKSMTFIITILSVATVIINTFAIYLRKLPPPEISNNIFSLIYRYFIILIHISSLALLILAILFLILFLFKYGIMLIRKL